MNRVTNRYRLPNGDLFSIDSSNTSRSELDLDLGYRETSIPIYLLRHYAVRSKAALINNTDFWSATGL